MSYITGNKFKLISDYIFEEGGFRKTDVNNEIPIYFVKIDLIDRFFNEYKPNFPYKIITHNGDLPVEENHVKYTDDKNLISWYGQNINTISPKIKSIPIGIANEIWAHGNENTLTTIIEENNKKSNLLYCNFDIKTNIKGRTHCLDFITKNNLKMSERQDFPNYLRSLSKSFFSLSPNGNGVDCHRTWESLYLKTIPIVTKNTNIEFYTDLPIYIIDNWNELEMETLNENLYNKIISKYSIDKLNIEYYYNQIKQTI
jgi:hypothetical protein